MGATCGATALLERTPRDPEAVREHLLRLVERFERRGDRRAVFGSAYLIMTDEILAMLRRGEFRAPSWVERLTVHFYAYYLRALRSETAGAAGPLAPAWRVAFDCCDRGDDLVLRALLLGMNAHINHDLPLALADLLRAGGAALESDYERVLGAVQRVIGPIQRRVGQRYAPGLLLLGEAMLGFDEWFTFTVVRAWRRTTWEQARALASPEAARERRRVVERSMWIARLLSFPEGPPHLVRSLARLEQLDVRALPRAPNERGVGIRTT